MSQTWKEKIKALKAGGVELDLGTLIGLAVSHTLSSEELTEVRLSWIVDELLLQNPKMRRNRAEALIRESMQKSGFLPIKTETPL